MSVSRRRPPKLRSGNPFKVRIYIYIHIHIYIDPNPAVLRPPFQGPCSCMEPSLAAKEHAGAAAGAGPDGTSSGPPGGLEAVSEDGAADVHVYFTLSLHMYTCMCALSVDIRIYIYICIWTQTRMYLCMQIPICVYVYTYR